MGFRLGALTTFQWGIEATAGTAVAATSQLTVPWVDIDAIDDVAKPNLARGYLMRNAGSEFVRNRGTTWAVPEHPPNFTQMLHWMSMSVGHITAPGASPAGVYTWAFARALATVPIADTYTLERRLTDGSTNTDSEWAFMHATDWTLTGKPNGDLGFSINGFARRRQNSTFTAGIFPTAVLPPTFARAIVSIDATFANLGVSTVTAQTRDFTLQFMSGFYPVYTADNRADQDFTAAGFNSRNSGFNFKCRFYVQGQYATELAQAELIGGVALQGIRYIRLEITHPTVITGASTYLMRFDMVSMCEKGTIVKIDEQDGLCLFELSVTETANGVNPWFTATIRNGSSAIA